MNRMRRSYGTQLVSGELPGCNGFLNRLSAKGSADLDKQTVSFIAQRTWTGDRLEFLGRNGTVEESGSPEPASPIGSNRADV